MGCRAALLRSRAMTAQGADQVRGCPRVPRPGLWRSVAPIGETLAEFAQALGKVRPGPGDAGDPVRGGFMRLAVQSQALVARGEAVPCAHEPCEFEFCSRECMAEHAKKH